VVAQADEEYHACDADSSNYSNRQFLVGNFDVREVAAWFSKFKTAEKEFIATDADGNGQLDVEEFKTLMKKLGVGDDSEAKKLFKEIDTDGNGNIDLKEFVFWHSTSPLVEAKQKFEEHDTDENGELDKEEFVKLLPNLKMKIEKSEPEKLFTDIDTDHKGNIDVSEFAPQPLCLSQLVPVTLEQQITRINTRPCVHCGAGGVSLTTFVETVECWVCELSFTSLVWCDGCRSVTCVDCCNSD